MARDYFSKRHISIIVVVAMVLNIANFSFALDSETISDICIEQTSSREYIVIDEDDDIVTNEKDVIVSNIDKPIDAEIFNANDSEDKSIDISDDIIEATTSESQIDVFETPKIKKDNKKKYINKYISPGFSVDVVKRDEMPIGDSVFGLPNLPASYDSRNYYNAHNVCIVPPVRDQNPYGTCWAHGTIGAIETSIRSKDLVESEYEYGSDLSEAAMALYVIEGLEFITDNNSYIDYPGVESRDFNCLNYDYYRDVEHIPRASMSFADSGGNEISALLMATTYMGIASEIDFPHTVENITAINNELMNGGLDNSRKPYAFNQNKYEVINVDFLSKNDRTSVKEAIMEHGSVAIGYYESREYSNCHEDNGEWYYLVPLKGCKIEDDGSCGELIDIGQNHAVTIVGWDDNIPRDRFYYDGEVYESRDGYVIASYSFIEDASGVYYPTYESASAIQAHSDGAWLVRNSWGEDADMHKDGYFWLPYDTLNLDDIMCSVDAVEAGTYMHNYHYDTTAAESTYNYHGMGYLANVFQVSLDVDQVLDAVNIAWQSANFDYDIYIYTNDNQMSNPVDGTLRLSQTVHNGPAGIKTVKLDKPVLLPRDTYFSIVVKPNNTEVVMFVEYTEADANSAKFYYDEVHYGESWENDDGTWNDLNATPIIDVGDRIYGCSPRIRGLTDEARIITFDPGIGTGSMAKQGLKLGSTGQIDSNEFTCEGYIFSNWVDNNGNEYNDGVDIILSDNITLTAQWEEVPEPSPTPAPTPAPSRGGGESGGGGGGQGPIPSNRMPTETNISNTKTISATLDSTQTTWVYDPRSNKYKLNINVNDNQTNAINGFYVLNVVNSVIVNHTTVPTVTQNTYYFDNTGSMVTGFVNTADGKRYFFENAKTVDEGKMIVGWKQIQNDWYYFGVDGMMWSNAITPDGCKVGVDGKWVK